MYICARCTLPAGLFKHVWPFVTTNIIIIIIIVSLFNVDAKNKAKKFMSTSQMMDSYVLNVGRGNIKYKILEVSTHPKIKELVNVYLGEIKYK